MDETGKELLKSLSLDELSQLKKDVNDEINKRLRLSIDALEVKEACTCFDADKEKYLEREDDENCQSVSGNAYSCTRPVGHIGKHHAHGMDKGECMDVW